MELNATYKLKSKMQSGKKVFGPLLGPGNEPGQTVKALKDFGYDFIMVDLEHSLVNKETIYSYIRSAREMDIPFLMRPEEKTAHFRCYLDAGVNGVMIPQLNTVEEAVYAINQSYFPPIGHRGCGIGINPYLLDFQSPAEVPLVTLTEYINNNTVVFVMTESLENISNLRRILSLEGVTGTIVGTFDLAFDIGGIDPKALMPEAITTAFVEERLRQVAKICKDAGKVAGIGGFQPKGCARWAKEGYQLFILGYVIDGNVDNLRPLIEEASALVF